jgi:hypothetical protein
MEPWLVITASIIVFLLSGLAVSEYFCRRVNARHAKQWTADHTADSSAISVGTSE